MAAVITEVRMVMVTITAIRAFDVGITLTSELCCRAITITFGQRGTPDHAYEIAGEFRAAVQAMPESATRGPE